jgi:hypothetical protein
LRHGTDELVKKVLRSHGRKPQLLECGILFGVRLLVKLCRDQYLGW